jgi:hypothetical protein
LASLTAGDPRELVVGVKDDADRFAEALRGRGCQVELTPTRELHILLAESTGAEPAGGAALVWDVALELGVQVRRLEPRRVSLDEAFLRLVSDGAPTPEAGGETPAGAQG